MADNTEFVGTTEGNPAATRRATPMKCSAEEKMGMVLAGCARRARSGNYYIEFLGRGWYYLSTELDDYSRYILAWKQRRPRPA